MRSLLLVFLFCSVIAAESTAQKKSKSHRKADALYGAMDYREAIYYYESALEKNAGNADLARKIGLSYRHLGQIKESLPWFEQAKKSNPTNPEDQLHYAEALKSNERYAEAVQVYSDYAKLVPGDSRAARHLQDPEYYMDLLKSTDGFNIRRLELNDEYPAFGVSKMDEGYLFSSSGPSEKFGAKGKSVFTEQPYLDVYVGDKNENDEITNIRPIEGSINTKFHDGPATYDRNNNTIYVTRNNIKGRKPVKDKTGTIHLKIYAAKREQAVWTAVEELPFNSEDYSNAHPCISPDGRWLYFSSNRPGGLGGTDLYKVEKTSTGWGQPTNLGPQINTEGDEMFPHLHTDGHLYFCSDGHAGLGGLDVFQSKGSASSWAEPANVGRPVNTSKDDFAMFYDYEKNTGYFSSNREDDNGDDLFWFEDLRIEPKFITGRVFYTESETPVKNSKLIFTRSDSHQEVASTDENGRFRLLVSRDDMVNIDIYVPDGQSEHKQMLSSGLTIDSPDDLGVLYAYLPKSEPEVAQNTTPIVSAPVETLNEAGYATIELLADLKINNVYFDYNSSIIKQEAVETMRKVLEVMAANPKYKLEISAHTDSRGTSDYNQQLSRKRAENAKQFLIEKGLSADKIVMNWFGKSKLDIECPPGADCDELIHRANRRAEFKIVTR